MLRTVTLMLASVPLVACGGPMLQAVQTTEASTALEQVTRSNTNEFDPATSPDGTALAYEVAASVDATPHVEVMSLGKGSPAPKIEYSSKDQMGLEPTWMPDGSGIIFVSNALGNHRLVQTMGVNPEMTAFLANAGDPYHFAAWPAVSPDGRRMAMSLVHTDVFVTGWRSLRSLDPALGISDLRGSGVALLGSGTDPAWSPDGKRLVFSRAVDGHLHLFVAAEDGKDATQLTEGPDDDEQPAWSPDGRFIVFCSAHGSEERVTQANLFVVRADGSGLVQLTEGDRISCRPSWGKDGAIYFHANATDRFHIWRLKPLGGFANAHVVS